MEPTEDEDERKSIENLPPKDGVAMQLYSKGVNKLEVFGDVLDSAQKSDKAVPEQLHGTVDTAKELSNKVLNSVMGLAEDEEKSGVWESAPNLCEVVSEQLHSKVYSRQELPGKLLDSDMGPAEVVKKSCVWKPAPSSQACKQLHGTEFSGLEISTEDHESDMDMPEDGDGKIYIREFPSPNIDKVSCQQLHGGDVNKQDLPGEALDSDMKLPDDDDGGERKNMEKIPTPDIDEMSCQQLCGTEVDEQELPEEVLKSDMGQLEDEGGKKVNETCSSKPDEVSSQQLREVKANEKELSLGGEVLDSDMGPPEVEDGTKSVAKISSSDPKNEQRHDTEVNMQELDEASDTESKRRSRSPECSENGSGDGTSQALDKPGYTILHIENVPAYWSNKSVENLLLTAYKDNAQLKKIIRKRLCFINTKQPVHCGRKKCIVKLPSYVDCEELQGNLEGMDVKGHRLSCKIVTRDRSRSTSRYHTKDPQPSSKCATLIVSYFPNDWRCMQTKNFLKGHITSSYARANMGFATIGPATYRGRTFTVSFPSPQVCEHARQQIDGVPLYGNKLHAEIQYIDFQTLHSVSSSLVQPQSELYNGDFCSLYISNLPVSWRFIDVKKFVIANVPNDVVKFMSFVQSGKPGERKAIVDFTVRSAAEVALEKLHGKEINGQRISCQIVDFDSNDIHTNTVPPEPTPKGEPQPVLVDQTQDDNVKKTYGVSLKFLNALGIHLPLTNTIKVSNLNRKIDDCKLREVFGLAGHIVAIKVLPTFEEIHVLTAKIKYTHPLEAVQAISMFHKQYLYKRIMFVVMDSSPLRHALKLPTGLTTIGPGLGLHGCIIRCPTSHIEITKLKDIVQAIEDSSQRFSSSAVTKPQPSISSVISTNPKIQFNPNPATQNNPKSTNNAMPPWMKPHAEMWNSGNAFTGPNQMQMMQNMMSSYNQIDPQTQWNASQFYPYFYPSPNQNELQTQNYSGFYPQVNPNLNHNASQTQGNAGSHPQFNPNFKHNVSQMQGNPAAGSHNQPKSNPIQQVPHIQGNSGDNPHGTANPKQNDSHIQGNSVFQSKFIPYTKQNNPLIHSNRRLKLQFNLNTKQKQGNSVNSSFQSTANLNQNVTHLQGNNANQPQINATPNIINPQTQGNASLHTKNTKTNLNKNVPNIESNSEELQVTATPKDINSQIQKNIGFNSKKSKASSTKKGYSKEEFLPTFISNSNDNSQVEENAVFNPKRLKPNPTYDLKMEASGGSIPSVTANANVDSKIIGNTGLYPKRFKPNPTYDLKMETSGGSIPSVTANANVDSKIIGNTGLYPKRFKPNPITKYLRDEEKSDLCSKNANAKQKDPEIERNSRIDDRSSCANSSQRDARVDKKDEIMSDRKQRSLSREIAEQIVFKDLPDSVTEHMLQRKMKEVGEVICVEMTRRGQALVRFVRKRDADRCIKLFHKSRVDGQVISVKYLI